MSDASPNDTPASPGGGKKLSLEVISQAFQQELEAGRHPRIEKVLSQLKAKYHERVLRNLMISEIGFHRRGGKSPLQADYLARFPAYSEVINEVFEFLGPGPLSKPLPTALKSVGAISMIASQSSLDFAIPIDENSVIETSNELKRTSAQREGRTTSSGDTTSDSKARTNPGKRQVSSRPGSATKDQPPKSASVSETQQKSSLRHKSPVEKSPVRNKTAPIPAADLYDDDLNSLLSVQLPQEPRRKRTAKEIEEVQERLERRKERQRKKDRDKRLKVKVEPEGITEQEAGPQVPLGEFQLPLIVTVVSAFLNVLVILLITQDQFTLSIFLALKMVLLVFAFGSTLLGLYVAAFLLGTQYGYLHTAILKVAAICLTQSWISELFYVFPVPFLFFCVGCFVAFILFELFFEIDTLDAIYSVIIVSVTRFIVAVYFWMFLIELASSNFWIIQKAAIQLQEQAEEENPQAQVHNQKLFDDAQARARKEINEVANDDKFGEIPRLPAPRKPKNADQAGEEKDAPEKIPQAEGKETGERVEAINKYSHQFANLIIVEDFEAAYELMSREYRDEKSLADFKTALIDWRNDVGYPVGAKEDVETFDATLIQQKPVAEDLNLPDEKILALAVIHFSIDLDLDDQFLAPQVEDELGSKMHLVMVDEEGKMRIAAFGQEY